MRIVLDTNVLVAGFISPSGPPGAILRSILAGRVTVCFDERILAEYRDVLTRSSFAFDGDRVAEVLDLVEATGEPVLAEDLGIALPDAADAMFVEVATAAGGRLSGDRQPEALSGRAASGYARVAPTRVPGPRPGLTAPSLDLTAHRRRRRGSGSLRISVRAAGLELRRCRFNQTHYPSPLRDDPVADDVALHGCARPRRRTPRPTGASANWRLGQLAECELPHPRRDDVRTDVGEFVGATSFRVVLMPAAAAGDRSRRGDRPETGAPGPFRPVA